MPQLEQRLPSLEQADRMCLLEEHIEVVADYDTYIQAAGRPWYVHVADDTAGERYVRLNQKGGSPEKQRFVSLFMKPVCGLADVVRLTDKTCRPGETRFYSHMIRLESIEPRRHPETEMRGEMFLLDAVAVDADHFPFETPTGLHNKNTVAQGSKFYLFDFDMAFSAEEVFRFQRTPEDIAGAQRRKLDRLFGRELGSARDWMRDKIAQLQRLYDGDEGYELYKAELREAGIDADLTQLFSNARRYWRDPVREFYEYIRLRIDTAAAVLDSY